MKIAIVIERFDPAGGGAEKSTAQIACHLRDRGHEVTILTWWSPPLCGFDGITVDSATPRRRLGMIQLYRFTNWVRKRLSEGEFDSSLSVTTAAPAAVVQPRSGTIRETSRRNVAMRVSRTRRTMKKLSQVMSGKLQVQLALERRTLADRQVKRFCAVSRYVAWQLENDYAVNSEMIEVIANGSDMPDPDVDQRRHWRKVIRNGFGISADTPAFLFAAHNPRLKGIDTVLAAMKILRQRGQEAVVMIAGPMQYGLQASAVAYGIRDRLRFVGPTDRMAELYCGADVTVLPTYYDPSSKVAIESLMMRTPVITTAYNGASDWVAGTGGSGPSAPEMDPRQPTGCVLADPADAVALADAMVQLSDPDKRASYAHATVGLADRLSMSRHVESLERVLVEVSN